MSVLESATTIAGRAAEIDLNASQLKETTRTIRPPNNASSLKINIEHI